MSEQSIDTNSSAPAPAIPETKNIPTVGRVLMCFRAAGWTRHKSINEVRPGICVSSFPGANQNVNVFLDGGNDREILAQFRESPQGNTLMSVPVYDPLTNEQRAEVAKRCSYWCEWPPMPPRPAAPPPTHGNDKLLEAFKLFLSDPCEAVGKKILKQLES